VHNRQNIMNSERINNIKKLETLLQNHSVEMKDLPDFNKNWMESEPVFSIDELSLKRILKIHSKNLSFKVSGIAAAVFLACGVFTGIFFQKDIINIYSPSSSSETAEKLRGLVLRVKGDVSVEKNGNKKMLYKGEVVARGDVIQTESGEVDIALSSGTILRLKDEGRFTFNKLDKSKTGQDTEISLEKGSLFSTVDRLSEKDTYVVKTPTAIAGVRGTSFLVTASHDHTEIHVVKGSISVNSLGEKGSVKEKILEEGDQGIVINSQGENFPSEKSSSDEISSEFKDMGRSVSEIETDVFNAAQDLPEAKNEEELKRNYNRDLIEIVRLKDGRLLHGLVVSQVGSKIIFQTVGESYVFNADDVMDISYKEELSE